MSDLKNDTAQERFTAATKADRPSLKLRWDANFEELRSYVQEHGKLPPRYGELHRLYEWAVLQRYKHRKGTLLPEREERLAAIPGILFEKVDRLGQLEQFHAAHGRLPKIKAADPAEHSLAVYLVHGLRRLIVDGTINQAMLARAEAIPGAVDVRRRPDQDQRLEELRAFVAEKGYLPRNLPGEVVLRDWVRNNTAGDPDAKTPQLRSRHHAVSAIVAGTLSYTEFRWRQNLADTEAFCHEHGHLPGRTIPGSEPLAKWLREQHEPLEAGLFDEVTSRRLQNVLDHPTAQEYIWQSRLSELEQFITINGRPPRGFHEEGYTWLSKQRRDFRKGLLSTDRVEALSKLDGALPVIRPLQKEAA